MEDKFAVKLIDPLSALWFGVGETYIQGEVSKSNSLTCKTGAKVDWDFRISDLVKNPDGTDVQPLWQISVVSRAQLAKSTILTSSLVPLGIFSDILRSIQMLKREWGVESNGKLPHLLNP